MNQPHDFYESVIRPIEDRLIRSAWRLTRNAQDAEDALQDALLTIWKRHERINRHPAPRALILRIGVDAACDVARRRMRRRGCLGPPRSATEPVDAAFSPAESLERRELADEVLTALKRLGRRQATAIALRVFEGLPYAEIAKALGCREATARRHVDRARAHLRLILARHASPTRTRNGP